MFARRSARRRNSGSPMDKAKRLAARRKRRNRRNLARRAGDRARLSVHRSGRHIYAQVIRDDEGRTVAAASTLEKELRETLKTGADVAAAKAVGKLVAERAPRRRRRQRRVRPRPPISITAGSGRAGGSRARSRAVLLAPEIGRSPEHGERRQAPRRPPRRPARPPEGRRRERPVRQTGQHQPRRQGGEGRAALRFRRPSWWSETVAGA